MKAAVLSNRFPYQSETLLCNNLITKVEISTSHFAEQFSRFLWQLEIAQSTEKVVCNQSLEIQKDNGMAAMLDDKTKRSVIQHGCHTIVFWISRDWLQTSYNWLIVTLKWQNSWQDKTERRNSTVYRTVNLCIIQQCFIETRNKRHRKFVLQSATFSHRITAVISKEQRKLMCKSQINPPMWK